MPFLHRRLHAVKMTALAAALGATTAGSAQKPQRPLLARTILFTFPQFVAEAVSIRALDETGPDRPGSDEVYAVFADFDPVSERRTAIFGDVDAGETKRFAVADRCLSPLPGCTRGKSALHLGVALWEDDPAPIPFTEFCPGALANSHQLYNEGLCPSDDLIGRFEIKLSRQQLLAALPTVGGTATYTVKPSGDSGSYEFTYRITRRADIQRSIVIHLPPGMTPSITLQAMTSNPSPNETIVDLSWSGAAGTSVDLYRNAAKLTTTANDGAYSDRVTSGSYQYRLCNLNSTNCSAVVNVTVP